MSNIIDGKIISSEVKDKLKEKINKFNTDYNREISLAVVLVGEDPASTVYVRNKIKACEYVGIKSLSYNLPATSSQEEVEDLIKKLAEDDLVDGILVQLPLPKGLNEKRIIDLIPFEKDVDGFKAENIGRLLLGEDATIACTPFGVLKMLKYKNVEISGKNAVVIGRSNIVGKPMAFLLLQENATVTICHSKTKNLKEICSKADILVAAIGKPKFVAEDMVKEGAIVIDVGINRVDGKLCGDVDYEAVKDKASLITPVPGGVGPMTIAMLMENTYLAALRREN